MLRYSIPPLLYARLSSVAYSSIMQYAMDTYSVACVKDLIRALREDDSQCEIRRHLGQAEILKKVLIGRPS